MYPMIKQEQNNARSCESVDRSYKWVLLGFLKVHEILLRACGI